MPGSRTASIAALLALGAVAGTATFLSARDEPDAPGALRTGSVVTRPARPDEVAAAIASSLRGDLEVELTPAEAACVTDGLLAEIGVERAAAWAAEAPGALSAEEREGLVRVVVRCLPDGKAAAILGGTTTSTVAQELPDE